MCVISWFLCSLGVAHAIASAGSDSTISHGVDTEQYPDDPINSFRVMYPADGAVETNPVEFRAEIGIKSIEQYKAHYGGRVMCVELSGESEMKKCTPMLSPSIIFDGLAGGNYTARALIKDADDGTSWYHRTPETRFSIVGQEELAARKAAMRNLAAGDAKLFSEISLLEWAEHQRQHWEERVDDVNGERGAIAEEYFVNNSTPNGNDVVLVIGVKTAVVENFAFRQAIRETWASADTLRSDVKVIFVGCRTKFDEVQGDAERELVKNAIKLEKRVYGDLLTEELDCEDSYSDLANKVKQFLCFATDAFPQTPFIMIADDDMYLRTERLADELRKEENPRQLYIGQVWDELLGRSQEPVRDLTERYFIPEDMYPLSSYPPFAFGPHYVLSMDCACFIAKNHKRLRGLGPIDDVSVALWLLTLQVHVEHTPAFSSLGIGECKSGLLSVADLSPFGIRSIHSNVISKRDLCHGFDRIAWQKSKHLTGIQNGDTPRWNIHIKVHNLHATKFLEVTSTISFPEDPNISATYSPAAESLASYTRRICAQLQSHTAGTETQSSICRSLTLELRTQLQEEFLRLKSAGAINLAFMELWRYNIFDSDPDLPPRILAYSDNAAYGSVLLECLFVAIYDSQKHPILVMPEWTLGEYYGSVPEVFVFSILDDDCDPVAKPACQTAVARHFRKYSRGPNPATIMMIAGEPTDTEGLDERVILVSTVSSVAHKHHAYLNVASTSFGERLGHSPTALLSPATTYIGQEAFGERLFCAYLYARCDRPQREYMFDILNAMEAVDALGVCAGSSRLPDLSYRTSRFSNWYNDDAVTTFQRYKFVIAFENSGVPGYATEKLVNPLLAGSIPIYLGNSTTVSELFNPNSFIDCGRFEKLRDCAQHVVKIHRSPELYEHMRREPPIRNIAAFNEAFSWHPSVLSRDLADKVAKLIQATQR